MFGCEYPTGQLVSWGIRTFTSMSAAPSRPNQQPQPGAATGHERPTLTSSGSSYLCTGRTSRSTVVVLSQTAEYALRVGIAPRGVKCAHG